MCSRNLTVKGGSPGGAGCPGGSPAAREQGTPQRGMSDPMLPVVTAASGALSSGPPTMRTDSEAEPGRVDPTDEEETFATVYAEGMPQSPPPVVRGEVDAAASDAQLSDLPAAAGDEQLSNQPEGEAASSKKDARLAECAADPGESAAAPEQPQTKAKVGARPASFEVTDLEARQAAVAAENGEINHPDPRAALSDDERAGESGPEGLSVLRKLSPLQANVLRRQLEADDWAMSGKPDGYVSDGASESVGEESPRDSRSPDTGRDPTEAEVRARAVADALERPRRTLAPLGSPASQQAEPQIFKIAESPPSFEEFEAETGTRGDEKSKEGGEGNGAAGSVRPDEDVQTEEEEEPSGMDRQAAWAEHVHQIDKFVEKWELQERMHKEMRAWPPDVCSLVLAEFKPYGPKQKAWDGMVIAVKVKITHRLQARREQEEEERKLAAQLEAEEAEERSSSSEYDGGEREQELLRQLRARGVDRAMWYGESSFTATPGLRKVFRDWMAEGPLPGVIHDFVVNLSAQERAAIKLNIAVREAEEEGLLEVKHTPVKEMEAFAAARAAQFAEADNREGQPGEFRFPFAKEKKEREEEAEDRRAVAQALAERHNQSFEWGMNFLINRRRLALMPLEDWRDGATVGPRLPSLFPTGWTSQDAARGGPPMSTEERQQYQLPHPDFGGEWGRMRSHLHAQYRNEFGNTAWRDLGLRHRGKTFRAHANAQRENEDQRIAEALSKGGVPISLPSQADRVWVSSWFATGLIKAVKYSGGGWKHPNPHGALADNESNRVPLDADEIALLEAQIADHARREKDGSATWGRPASLEAELWEASANRKDEGAWTDDGEVEELYEVARGAGAIKSSINVYGERVVESMPKQRPKKKDLIPPKYGTGIPRYEQTTWEQEQEKWLSAEERRRALDPFPGGAEIDARYREMQVSQARYEEAMRAGNEARKKDPGSAEAEAYKDHVSAAYAAESGDVGGFWGIDFAPKGGKGAKGKEKGKKGDEGKKGEDGKPKGKSSDQKGQKGAGKGGEKKGKDEPARGWTQGPPAPGQLTVIQPEGEAKGRVTNVDERGKTWTGANAIPVGGWKNARNKQEENRNTGASEQVEKARKKGFEEYVERTQPKRYEQEEEVSGQPREEDGERPQGKGGHDWENDQGSGGELQPGCTCLPYRRDRPDWPTLCACNNMAGHGSGDYWINTNVPPHDPRRKTRLVKADEGGQWEASRGRWGLQPNRDWDQRWNHYARYDHANEQSGGYWGYQQARAKGQGEEDGGKGKWRSWD